MTDKVDTAQLRVIWKEAADELDAVRKQLTEARGSREKMLDSRRERIATAAMQGMLSNPNIVNDKFKENLIASWAVDCAYALIAELDKKGKE